LIFEAKLHGVALSFASKHLGINDRMCFPPGGDSPEPYGTGRHIPKAFGIENVVGKANELFFGQAKKRKKMKPGVIGQTKDATGK